MDKIKIKNEFSEVDLIKGYNTIKEIIEETTTKIKFYRNKMLFIISYLDIRIEEETQENIKKDELTLKVTTNELIKYNIDFSMPINSILASITVQENLIILK